MKVPGLQPPDVLKTIEGVVGRAKAMVMRGAAGGSIELEIRFGSVSVDGIFTPGMTAEDMRAVEQSLDSCRDWAQVDDWCTSYQYFHGSAIPGDGRALRSEVTYRSATDRPRTCVSKNDITKTTYQVLFKDTSVSTATGAFRVALSEEYNVPDEDIPMWEVPKRCCIKERKEYLYTPRGKFSEPAWAFHLTKRWVASKYLSCIYLQQTEEPFYDIEMEIRESYLRVTEVEEIAFKLMWKIYDIINMLKRDEERLGIEDFSIRFVK